MKYVLPVLLAFFLLLTGEGQVYAGKRALIISIEKYKDPHISQLKGCVNDGRSIKGLLKAHLNFKDSEIRFMKNHEATRSAILKGFDDWLIRGTRPGDKVFIYYSGHGSYFKDFNGDEKDEYPAFDEALCPYDMETGPTTIERKANLIIDDEIGERLSRLNGRLVVMIFDSCHSGTATRAMGETETVRSLKEGLIYLDGSQSTRGLIRGDLNSSAYQKAPVYALSEEIEKSKSYMLFLSAASPKQKAYEVDFKNERHGILTYSIIQSFKNNRSVRFSDIENTFYRIKKQRGLARLNQDPQIEGNPGLMKRSFQDIFKESWMADMTHAAQNSPANKPLSVLNNKTRPMPPKPPPISQNSPIAKPAILSLWANEKGKRTFNLSDTLRFHVRCSEAGYLYLFNLIESSEKMYLIYPNEWSFIQDSRKFNYIRENKEILIPPLAVRGKPITFQFQADQRGKEAVIAIVSKKPWDEMDKIIGKNHEPAKVMSEKQKSEILKLLYRRQSEYHMTYKGKRPSENDWAGTSLNIEIR